MFKVVIFDIGNTLLYDRPDKIQSVAFRLKKFAELTLTQTQKERIQKSMLQVESALLLQELQLGKRVPDDVFLKAMDLAVLKVVYEEDEGRARQVLEAFSHIRPPERTLFVPQEVYRVLDAFKARGQRMSIVSNYTSDIVQTLKEKHLTHYFEDLVISECVGVEKPDKRIMEIALQRLHEKPADCLYVGDHPFDVLCAKEAGLHMAWLTADNEPLPAGIPYKEDYRIANIQDLLKCMDGN